MSAQEWLSSQTKSLMGHLGLAGAYHADRRSGKKARSGDVSNAAAPSPRILLYRPFPLPCSFFLVATKELQAIIHVREQSFAQGRPAALVTVFKTAGSTYRRPGARMLVLPTHAGDAPDLLGADTLGSISGGCLEDDARERALQTLATGQAISVVYDTTAEADILFGSGVGCQGVVHALIQPLPAPNSASLSLVDSPQPTTGNLQSTAHADPLACIARALRERRAGALASVCTVDASGEAATAATAPPLGAFLWLDGDDQPAVGPLLAHPALAGAITVDARTTRLKGRPILRAYPLPGGGRVDVFIDAILPPRSLLICGAGQDAAPLARLGKLLGWRVRVVDGRRAYATRARFPDVDQLTVCPPRESGSRMPVEPGEAVVLMTHNYLHDKEFLRTALASSAGYIGVLGPRRRTERLLSELADLPGAALGKRSLRRVHGPAGLDIGAEAPEQIALAIVAEIEAVAARRRGGVLKHRRAPLHETPRPSKPPLATAFIR